MPGSAPERPNLQVAVAHFTAPDGAPAPEGASVMQALVDEWTQGDTHRLTRPLGLIPLRQSIPDSQTAFEIAQSQRADVVIWGSIEPGGTANTASLRPRLLWWPRRALPTDRSLSVRERLAQPVVYELAVTPLNGQVVLGQILNTLDLYQSAEYDAVLQSVNVLLDQYAVGYAVDGQLRPDLLLSLRGSIASMQEQWSAAELDYRAAIEATSPGRAEYWNNLAVALAAQGRIDEAGQALNTAQAQSDQGGGNLAAIQLNRGLIRLRGPDPAAAAASLGHAHELLPNGVVTLVSLAEAQRRANQFDQAVAAINRALELAPNDPLVQLESSRIELAQLVGVGDQPLWELEIAPELPHDRLTALRTRLDSAVATLESMVVGERQQAASDDASGRPESGRVHEGTARQLSSLLSEARYWRSVALTEEGVAAARNRPGGLRGLWNSMFGDDTPLVQAQKTLAPLAKSEENNYDIQLQSGRVYRLLGSSKVALDYYTRASEINPNRPEAWYGLASTRWEREAESPERNEAIRAWLAQSIAADPRFTPAYLLMARLELRDKQWAAALPSLQWLKLNRPDQIPAQIALGEAQRELGQLAEAELTLLPLANANNGAALVELARVYLQASQVEAAETVLRRALELDSTNAIAAYELGRLLQNQGNYAGAEQAYTLAIAANEAYMEAHLALGQLYGRYLNDPQRAVTAYRRAIEAGGTDARNFEDLGREFLEIGQYAEAADALEQSIALNPNVPESRHALAQAYRELGRYDAAREQDRAAIARKADGLYIDAQIGIGESFRRQGRPDEAIEAYNVALDAAPDSVPAYVGLGRTAADKQDWQAAIGYYNQALARDADDANAHFWLGQALVEQGHHELALAEFQLVLANPATSNTDAFYGAGRAYMRMAEGLYYDDPAKAAQYDAEARSMLDAALSRRPTFPQALLERGILNERQGQVQAALADYGQAAELNQLDATALFLQGKLYLSLNNVASATEALENSVRRDPNSATSLYWLGRAYRAQSRPADAIKSFSRAVSINGGYTEARYFQGLTEEEENQLEAARSSYEAIVAQSTPDDRWRQQAEQRLRELGQ
ncbi:MAG: tetratricopeptide repeat protein [Herpetosiphonaceae bacterium]|nr:tetratricopeptide repeat protein [Herpetosiphonaceae bacterium]